MFQHKLTLPDGTVLGAERIRSVTVTEQVNDETDLCPGAACAACAEVELWAPPGSARLAPGTEFTLTRVDTATGTQTPVGVFCTAQPQKASANVVKVTAYDRMTLLDKDLSPWLREQQGSFPLSLAAFVQAVCAQCGVTLAGGALDGALNTGYAVQAFYADGLTGRQLIRWAAQAMGRFARMDPDGLLEFAWYTAFAGYGIAPGTSAADSPAGTPQCGYFQGGLSYEDYETAPLDKVQIKQSDDDVGVLYPPDETGTNALVIQGNLLLTTASADALRPVAQALYEQLHSVTYTPLQVSLPLTADAPAPGQIVTVTDPYGRTMQAYVMQRTVAGQRVTLESTGNARRDGTAAVNRQTYQNLQGKMLELSASVDGLKVTASDLEGAFSQLEQTVDGISTTVSNVQGDMTSLEQTVDGFSLTVSKAGDTNLFGDAAWNASGAGVTVNGKTVAITAPATDRAGASLDVPAGNLAKIGGATYIVSVEYRVTAAINTGNNASGIVLWMDYPDGNLYSWVKVLYNPGGSATPAQGWTTATVEMTGKGQPPTRVYLYAYLYDGSGAVELRNPALYQKTAGSVISLTSNGVTIGTAADIVQVDETREAFAQGDHSVTINSGTITFAANTLVVDSDNFKLQKDGTVIITGSFYSRTQTDVVAVSNGALSLSRTLNSGETVGTATLWSYGSNDAYGRLDLYGPGADGSQIGNVSLHGSYSGGAIRVFNAANALKFAVTINGNGDAEVWVNGTKRF